MSNRKTVLVVDDSATMRHILRTELEDRGYDVFEASNGEEALELVMTETPDLVTLDMDMPVLNGFETCQRLSGDAFKKAYSHHSDKRVPVIFITSNDTLDDRRRGFELGATDFITKPFARGDVADVVSKILKPGTHLENLTALVVDDSSTARMIVRRIMEREGVTVVEANDGDQAFEIMCNRMGDIDLLITDLFMPRMNGDELCRKIRNELNLKDIPIIFLTAMSEQSELLDLFKSGGTDYIVKPFVKEELLSRLTVHLERAALNIRLRNSVRELRSLNVIKSHLVSLCSHDFQTPLTSVMGFADHMLSRDDVTSEERQTLLGIKASLELLLNVINDMHHVSELKDEMPAETTETGAFDLARISYNTMKHMARKKKQQVELIDKTDGCKVNVNKTGMIRVLNNLLSNAVKFTPEQGNITIEVDSRSVKGTTVFTVTDTGPGIPEEKRPYLFEKFTPVSSSGTHGESGPGLGLSIVRDIVETHLGTVTVESKAGEGTSICVSIPGDAVRAGTGELSAPADRGSGKGPDAATCVVTGLKVLVAEDSKTNAEVIKNLLTGFGHRVKVVESAVRAVGNAREEAFDLILLSVMMPDMEGTEAARKIRDTLDTAIPVIALIGNADRKIVESCFGAGMNDYIMKPFTSEELQKKVALWCG